MVRGRVCSGRRAPVRSLWEARSISVLVDWYVGVLEVVALGVEQSAAVCLIGSEADRGQVQALVFELDAAGRGHS